MTGKPTPTPAESAYRAQCAANVVAYVPGERSPEWVDGCEAAQVKWDVWERNKS
jgi:hypothetical protein